MARNAPIQLSESPTVGELQRLLDRWVANRQGISARVVIEDWVEDVTYTLWMTRRQIGPDGRRDLVLYVSRNDPSEAR